MRTGIYYFTGTGNSLAAARDIARELGDATLIPIPRALKEGIDQSFDRIGIVFPVYMWGVPLIVAEFLKKLSNPNAYYFAVATCGAMACATLKQADKLLASQGLKLAAGFFAVMPGNYTPMYGAISDKKQKKMFDAEKLKVKRIADAVKNGRTGIVETNFGAFSWLLSSLVYNFSAPRIPAMDKSFFADQKCDGCGICQRVCPVNNVQIVEGKPRWSHKCEQCLACLQWCPKEAIQAGKSTSKRKRYHHPEVSLRDILTSK